MSLLPIVLACAAACLAGCATSRARASEPTAPARFQPAGNEAFVACNERVDCGTRVVLWTEEPRYSAYASEPRFRAKADAAPLEPCYRAGRWREVELAEGAAAESAEPEDEALVAPWSGDLDALRGTVDQLVLHYDAAGFSRTCFDVLHDRRGLSAHFLLDLDGTLYQTLDLRETAWHATRSNPRSIGIEIANIGAYRPGASTALEKAYAADAEGPIARMPADGGGLLRAGFVARPARAERVRGVVQGAEYEQHDFTPEQYESLARLTAALCQTFPALRPDAPRGADGTVLARVLDGEEWREFQGILGHLHVQANKIDPGPAFDWERFLARVRERMAERAALATAP